ncbi:MAG: hypothetical protein QG632_781 [Candidatus Dependentiae bacterium]|nr:hypothetical protein [Candidatus Dependentiae bacterium]
MDISPGDAILSPRFGESDEILIFVAKKELPHVDGKLESNVYPVA